jgi:hypothetical protein
MARPHTTKPHAGDGYVNPEVQFERTDVEAKGVVQFGIGLTVLIVGTMVAMVLLLRLIERLEKPRKESDLPPAAVDQSKGLPPIPLEGIEDVRDGRPRLHPPRAADYATPREGQLRKGGPDEGVLPIDRALEQYATELAGQDEQSKRKVPAAPAAFSVRLPSKAASGRVETGGQ